MTTSPISLSRRRFGLLAAGAARRWRLSGTRLGAGKTLTALGHRVHQTAATDGPGGDATEAFRKQAGATVNWVTFGDNNAIHERLLREVDAVRDIDRRRATCSTAAPCRATSDCSSRSTRCMKEAPIEDIGRFRAGPDRAAAARRRAARHPGPPRHQRADLQRGAASRSAASSELSTTFEELIEVSRKLTFKRDDGTQVYGLAFTPVFASNFLTLARCLGGDYMTADGKIVAAEAPHGEGALTVLADLYKQGVLPRNFATVNNEEITTWMQQGRVADDDQPFARLVTYNDPQKCTIRAIQVAAAADGGRPRRQGRLRADRRVLVAGDPEEREEQKPLAWELIRALSSKAGTTAMALNGNGPTRDLDLCRSEAEGSVALCGRRGGGARRPPASICRPSTSRPAPTTSSSRRRRPPSSASSRRKPRWTTRSSACSRSLGREGGVVGCGS